MEGELQKRHYGVGRWMLFGIISLTLLITGAFLAQGLWYKTHHRYDYPGSGYYHGSVNARLSPDLSDDIFFNFRFQGESTPKWQWVWTTNYYYEKLEFGWRGPNSEGEGKIELPSFTYELNQSTGALGHAVLSEWLLGKTNASLTPKETKLIEAVLSYLQAAKAGTLPGPNHHGHHFDTPLSGHIMHFRVGRGVASYVYIWCAIWLLLTIVTGYKRWRYIPGRKTIPDATKSNG